MKTITSINDFVIRFSNVNGTGSWSANLLLAKSIYRMGIPIAPKNIFPSNIQGLPTFYEIRVSEDGYIGTRGGVDIVVCVNPQSMAKDIKTVKSGGYFVYDDSKPLPPQFIRDDIHYLGLPLTDICIREYENPKLRLLFKNMIYVGALAAFLNIDFDILTGLVSEQFKGKEKLRAPNVHALTLGYDYALENFTCPLSIKVKSCDKIGDKILIDGNSALALGAIYGGATVAAWYPITPSTSVIDSFKSYAEQYRIDKDTGKNNFAIIQAEDELSAIGITLGASWQGARAFTATSGAGISLMTEFIGYAYFSETPAVIFNIQRVGPSTGMPTRTQQSDITSCAYASHGDTKHVLLFPSTPDECFDFGALSFDLADRLQTPIIVMSDLDIGMNDTLSQPFTWDKNRTYDRGKVLSAEDLENMDTPYGRYLDTDDDGIGYRTYPATHPKKGVFFTRGSSHNSMAQYTENSEDYVISMERLTKKWATAKKYVPSPDIKVNDYTFDYGVIYYGSSLYATQECLDMLSTHDDIRFNSMRIRSFPFSDDVYDFITKHKKIFLIEQNRDAQLRSLLINECDTDKYDMSIGHITPILCYDGHPITALSIYQKITAILAQQQNKEVA